MTWHRRGNKPLPESIMTHITVDIQWSAVITRSNIWYYRKHHCIHWGRTYIRVCIRKTLTYLALMGDLWGVFCEDFIENWSCHNVTALYIAVWANVCCFNLTSHKAYLVYLILSNLASICWQVNIWQWQTYHCLGLTTLHTAQQWLNDMSIKIINLSRTSLYSLYTVHVPLLIQRQTTRRQRQQKNDWSPLCSTSLKKFIKTVCVSAAH